MKSITEAIKATTASYPNEIPPKFHIDELYLAGLCGWTCSYDKLPEHLKTPEIEALGIEMFEQGEPNYNLSDYGQKLFSIFKELRENPANARYVIQIDVNGKDEDIASFWKAWPGSDELALKKGGGLDWRIWKKWPSSKGVILTGKPEGKHAEGTIFAIPELEKTRYCFFDDLFAAYPRLCFFIAVIDMTASRYAFWVGTNGKSYDDDDEIIPGEISEEYNPEPDKPGTISVRSWMQNFRKKFYTEFEFLPDSLKNPELCLEKVKGNDVK